MLAVARQTTLATHKCRHEGSSAVAPGFSGAFTVVTVANDS